MDELPASGAGLSLSLGSVSWTDALQLVPLPDVCVDGALACALDITESTARRSRFIESLLFGSTVLLVVFLAAAST